MAPRTSRPSLTPANPERVAAVRDAAIVLFAKDGYRGTTINDIADFLGIRGPSLYKHVRSKQAILREIIVSVMDEVLAAQSEAIAEHHTAAEQLEAMARAITVYHVENRERAFVCNREVHSLEGVARRRVLEQRDTYWHRTRELLDRGVATGEFSLSSTALATFSVIETLVGVTSWYDADRYHGRDDIAAEMATFVLRMVGVGLPAAGSHPPNRGPKAPAR